MANPNASLFRGAVIRWAANVVLRDGGEGAQPLELAGHAVRISVGALPRRLARGCAASTQVRCMLEMNSSVSAFFEFRNESDRIRLLSARCPRTRFDLLDPSGVFGGALLRTLVAHDQCTPAATSDLTTLRSGVTECAMSPEILGDTS